MPQPQDFNLPKKIIQKINQEGSQILITEYLKFAEHYAATAEYGEAARNYKMVRYEKRSLIENLPFLKTPQFIKVFNNITRLHNYYSALSMWQRKQPIDMNKLPQPEEYNLTKSIIKRVEQAGLENLETLMSSRRATHIRN